MLGYGVVMAFGSIALGDLSGDATVARWFVRRRGRALAVATMGLSSAGIVMPVPVALLIERFGWRAAWLVLGGVVLVLGLAATTVMRRRPEDYGLAPDVAPATRADRSTIDAPVVEVSLGARAATRTPAFWLLVLSTNLPGLGRLLRARGAGRHPRSRLAVPASVGRRRPDRRRRPLRHHR